LSPATTLIERKLAPPAQRAGMVVRERLLERLSASRDIPVVAVSAPPGYGKSTLLAQWTARDDRPSAWLSLDASDNNPAVLLRYLATAIDRVEPLPPRLLAGLERSQRIHGSALPRFRAALASLGRPILVVLDDVQVLTSPEAQDIIGVLADDLAPGSQVAFVSRDIPPVALGRLRARGRLVEFGTDDLALDAKEAAHLLRAAGVPLLPNDVIRLTERTEGWPAGLYLAALSIQASGSTAAIHATFRGTDRFVTDFLRSELLARLHPDDVSFLRRTSLLNEMCGPLVDHVLQTAGSAARLERLQASNLFVVPLDRSREWYRYHTLFRELLAHDLHDRDEPEVAELLGRASDWYLAHDSAEVALATAFEAGDFDRAARIFSSIALPTYWAGRLGMIRPWILQFGDHIGRYPEAAAIGSLLSVLIGDRAQAWRLMEIAAQDPPDGSLAGIVPLGRAVMLAGGLEEARRDAERAVAAAPRGSLLHPQALVILASILEAAGDDERAEAVLTEITELPAGGAAGPGRSLALSLRARLAMDRGDWASAEVLVRRARAIVASARLEDYNTTAAVLAVAARLTIHHGDHRSAEADLASAQRLRPLITDATPWFSTWTRVELGRAYLALGDTAGARAMVAEADDIVRVRPDLGTLLVRLADLRDKANAAPTIPSGMSTLTPAELRLLPYLTTHLTFAEIATRFGLSANTVKTQAASMYARLDVGSRAEAVERARKVGLLDG
jgi:LuxR family maltose regulon positive regulatory protein